MKNTMKWLAFSGLTLLALFVHADTQPGDKLQVQCGDHLVVLTCGHSDEIATRQKSRPRLCNDNKVDFVAKDGSTKTFKTYTKGRHRDKTPVRLICDVLLPINLFQVSVQVHDTAWSFGVLFSEDGKRLNNDNGDSLKLKDYPGYTYRLDYAESKTIGRVQIKESK